MVVFCDAQKPGNLSHAEWVRTLLVAWRWPVAGDSAIRITRTVAEVPGNPGAPPVLLVEGYSVTVTLAALIHDNTRLTHQIFLKP